MKLVGRSPGTWVFWLLIAATAAGRLAVAMADHRSLIAQDIYQDDAFYYLKIAENVAAGRGFTFDGQTPTSGFQPLYQLLLVPLAWLTRPSLTAPIRVSALLLAASAVATGCVYRLRRADPGPGPSLRARLSVRPDVRFLLEPLPARAATWHPACRRIGPRRRSSSARYSHLRTGFRYAYRGVAPRGSTPACRIGRLRSCAPLAGLVPL